MRRTNILFLTVMLFSAANCFASLIPISAVGTNQVPTSGAGYGNVLTLLNAQNTSGAGSDGLETNCDIISGGSAVSACTGPFLNLAPLNDAGNQNHAQSIGATGITNASIAASELLLVFNINQTGPHDTPEESITLDALGLTLWYNNLPIFTALRTIPDSYAASLQGIGVAGFGYVLDAAQAAAAQTAINTAIAGGATLNTLLVTGAFTAGCPAGTALFCANDGAETLFLSAHGAQIVPEPLSLALVGGGLLALGLFRKRFSA